MPDPTSYSAIARSSIEEAQVAVEAIRALITNPPMREAYGSGGGAQVEDEDATQLGMLLGAIQWLHGIATAHVHAQLALVEQLHEIHGELDIIRANGFGA